MNALFLFFFFQAEDGIRDYKVTGVQTCALPICFLRRVLHLLQEPPADQDLLSLHLEQSPPGEIGRASCRGKSVDLGGRRIIKKKKKKGTEGEGEDDEEQ